MSNNLVVRRCRLPSTDVCFAKTGLPNVSDVGAILQVIEPEGAGWIVDAIRQLPSCLREDRELCARNEGFCGVLHCSNYEFGSLGL